MTSSPTSTLEDLLAAHLAGEAVRVPPALQQDFDRALAAQHALDGLFQETFIVEEETTADRQPPAVSDDYEIEREIGRGGMGVVYLALQKSLGRKVALKVLRPGERTYGPLIQRFLTEAKHLARLRHPHIVSIHEIGDAHGEPYFTMDYVDGESLASLLRRGPLSPSHAVDVLQQIAAAVQHAHRQGIIHRDLKPSNVLIGEGGHVFVTDFGLARDVTQSSQLTMSGELLGTPQYMAPEQARGESESIGEATDIHALGMMLYEMLTGRPPYGAASAADTLVRLLHEEPLPPRKVDPRIPRDLETICLKMLQKTPQQRYANVSALLEDLRRFESGEPLLARRPSQWRVVRRWIRTHWRIAMTALITAACVLAAAPMLFDKSYEELVSWGDEAIAQGDAATAAKVYSRALQRANETQQRELADRMARVCPQLDDPKAAVDLALQVVKVQPGASFGRYDPLVAQALVAQVRANSPAGAIDLWQTTPQPELFLVKERLELALEGTLSDDVREDLTTTLETVNLALSQDQTWARLAPDRLHRLPTGTPAELLATVNDAAASPWNRGKAAIVLGRHFEGQGDRAEAVAAYRRALDLIRSVYPMLGGVKEARGSRPSRVEAPDAEETQLVRQLVSTLRRLAPESLGEQRGRLQFDVEGVALPETIGIDLTLQLCDPEIRNPNEGLSYNLPRLVPLRQDASVSVAVLDGLYRLEVLGHHGRWEPEAERFSRLLQVDLDDWPQTVEVRGKTVSLPPVRLRLADEISLVEPRAGDSVDLTTAELRWRAHPRADRYRLQVSYATESPEPTTSYFLFPETHEPRLRFAELSELEREQVVKNLTAGRTGGWRVDAFDAAGKRIGLSLEERKFFVARGLDVAP